MGGDQAVSSKDGFDEAPRGILRDLFWHRSLPFYIAPILLVVFGLLLFIPALYSVGWSAAPNLAEDLLRHGTAFCLLAIGAGLVIATSQIDLSAIGVATLSGVIFAISLSHSAVPASASSIAMAVVCSLSFSVFSGGLVSLCYLRLKAPLLIFTWALGSIYVVVSILVTQFASPLVIHDVSGVGLPWALTPTFWQIGNVGFTLEAFILLAAIVVIGALNIPQRAIAVGASETSAEYAGVSKRRTYAEVFVVNSILACFAGIFHCLYLSSASTKDLAGNELIPIAIAVIGGTSLSGGYFSLLAVVGAAFFWSATKLISPRLPEALPYFRSIQAEGGEILFYAVFILIALSFGRLLAPRFPRVFARQEQL